MAGQDSTDTTRDARLEARVSATHESLLLQAAALSGCTLSELVVASAQDAARRVIAEHASVRLSREGQPAFVQALLKPPQPNARLKRAAKAYRQRTGTWSVALTDITDVPLGRQHGRTAFECGVEALDRNLKQQDREDADKHLAGPFLAARVPEAHVLGHYVLSASALTMSYLPDGLTRKLPRYPQLRATMLGRLAVDRSTKGQGLEESLLIMNVMCRSLAKAKPAQSTERKGVEVRRHPECTGRTPPPLERAGTGRLLAQVGPAGHARNDDRSRHVAAVDDHPQERAAALEVARVRPRRRAEGPLSWVHEDGQAASCVPVPPGR